jgi:UPF0716 protein FxsA
MRRWVPWWVLALLFVVVPVVEIYLLIQVGQTIGAWWTVLLLVAAGFLGSWLVKREGSRAWSALTDALSAGRMPARELADGALILIGGTLLLTPGFLSDLVGAFCILPFTRPLARTALTRVVTRRLVGSVTTASYTRSGAGFTDGPRTRQRPGTDESVVRGEVVDEGK